MRIWPPVWVVLFAFSLRRTENSCKQRSGVKVTSALPHKIFNRLLASSYHFHSLCLLILMPYHLYFLCPDSLCVAFFRFVWSNALANTFHFSLQSDIAMNWKSVIFFHNLSFDRNTEPFHIVQATQSANNIDVETFARPRSFNFFPCFFGSSPLMC